MICAMTHRNLKPGTFDQFREAFLRDIDFDNPPEGFVRFHMLRNSENPDEVVTFGFFDGGVDDMRRFAQEQGYQGQMEAIAPYVDYVGADGLYEFVESFATREPQ